MRTGLPFSEDNPLSLERINNDIGYVDGNVIPVCAEWNHIRSSFTSSNIAKGIKDFEHKLKSATDLYGILVKRFERQNAWIEAKEAEREERASATIHKKPYIQAKSYAWWLKHQTLINAHHKKIAHYENLRLGLIESAAKKNQTGLSKKQKKVDLIYVEKLKNLNRVYGAEKSLMAAFYGNRKQVEAKGIVSFAELDGLINAAKEVRDTIVKDMDKQRRTVEYNERRLEIVKNLEGVLHKFENLSSHEKACIVAGLPLSTSRAKLLKLNIARKLLAQDLS